MTVPERVAPTTCALVGAQINKPQRIEVANTARILALFVLEELLHSIGDLLICDIDCPSSNIILSSDVIRASRRFAQPNLLPQAIHKD